MNQALEEVKNSIKAKNGNYLLETKPMVLGEDEKSLAEQLNEAKNKKKEDEEEEEEENEEDNQEGITANLPQFDAKEFQISKDKK